MEKELFEWTTWQEDGVGIFAFNKIKLVKQIGDFPIGTEFDVAFVNYENGSLEFGNFGPEVNNCAPYESKAKFKLSLNVQ